MPNIVYISLSISELQEHASSHCSLLWYTKGIDYQQNRLVLNHSTYLQRFVHVHVCIQAIELQELVRPIVMYGRKFFFVVLKKGDVYTNFTIPSSCVLPNSITS